MKFSTASGDTFEVSQDHFNNSSIRQSPDFIGIGPLPRENTFLPATFESSPTMGKPCVFKYDDTPEGLVDTITTDAVVHIQF